MGGPDLWTAQKGTACSGNMFAGVVWWCPCRILSDCPPSKQPARIVGRVKVGYNGWFGDLGGLQGKELYSELGIWCIVKWLGSYSNGLLYSWLGLLV